MINTRGKGTDQVLRSILARQNARLTVGYPLWLRPFVLKNVRALAIGSRIYLRSLDGLSPEALRRLLFHELVHVKQMKRDGLPGFFLRYLSSYLSGRLRGKSHLAAYRAIPYELEARLEEAELGTGRTDDLRENAHR